MFLKDEQSSMTNPALNYVESNGSSVSAIYGVSSPPKKNGGRYENHNSVILEHAPNAASSDRVMPLTNVSRKSERRKNDSIASTGTSGGRDYKQTETTNQKKTGTNRTSLVLGQIGRGKTARDKKREKLVYELFSYIISSQITTSKDKTLNMSQDALLHLDMIVDGKNINILRNY